MSAPHKHVIVSVEPGSEVTEEIAVVELGGGAYRVISAPALTLGLAEGDEFTIAPETQRPLSAATA